MKTIKIKVEEWGEIDFDPRFMLEYIGLHWPVVSIHRDSIISNDLHIFSNVIAHNNVIFHDLCSCYLPSGEDWTIITNFF